MLAMQNNGGFGNNSNWIWILFLWMMWQNGGFNNYRNGGGSFESLAAQMNGDSSREFIIQALNGKAEALAQLAQITNSNINTVQAAINGIQSSIQNVSAQVGITAAQTQNSILLGNSEIAKQICQCCCENKLAIANQTSALQSQLAQHDSNDAFADFGDNGFILFDNKESLISYATMKVRNNESIIDENNIAKLKRETDQYKEVLSELNQNKNNDETVKELKEQVNNFQAQLAEVLALLKNNNNK